MDGPQTEAAAVTAQAQTSAPAQPATEFKVPDGKMLVDATEYQRNQERVRGMQTYYERGSKAGFKRPEDLEKLGKFNATLSERGLNIDGLMQAFVTEQEDKGVDTEAMNPAKLEQMFEKWAEKKGLVKSADLDTREQKIHALSAHKESMAKESSAVDSFVKGLLGDTATDRDKRLLALYVKDTLESRRNVYPEGHPLHESELAAFDEKGLAPVFEEVKKFWAVGQGEEMAQAGDAALKGKVPSPAGAPPKAPSKPSKEVEMRPGGRFPVSTIEAAAAKKQAARGGKPISSIGG
jgi:hypothetical protein